MGSIIGQALPLALGIAISPVPIIAAILMLLSPRARTTSIGFLIGWLAGIIVVVSVFTLVSAFLPEEGPAGPKPILGTIQLLLGAALLFLAVKQWRGRPGPDDPPQLPEWMQSIDGVSFGGALGLGLLLAAANPKNLLLGASAGVTIGAAGLGLGANAAAIAVFTALAGCTVLAPVLGYLAATNRLAAPLGSLRDWLSRENAVVMTVVLLLLGVSVLGKGIGSF
ncbi:GAP family protein [Leucobacter sp.]